MLLLLKADLAPGCLPARLAVALRHAAVVGFRRYVCLVAGSTVVRAPVGVVGPEAAGPRDRAFRRRHRRCDREDRAEASSRPCRLRHRRFCRAVGERRVVLVVLRAPNELQALSLAAGLRAHGRAAVLAPAADLLLAVVDRHKAPVARIAYKRKRKDGKKMKEK